MVPGLANTRGICGPNLVRGEAAEGSGALLLLALQQLVLARDGQARQCRAAGDGGWVDVRQDAGERGQEGRSVHGGGALSRWGDGDFDAGVGKFDAKVGLAAAAREIPDDEEVSAVPVMPDYAPLVHRFGDVQCRVEPGAHPLGRPRCDLHQRQQHRVESARQRQVDAQFAVVVGELQQLLAERRRCDEADNRRRRLRAARSAFPAPAVENHIDLLLNVDRRQVGARLQAVTRAAGQCK